MYSEKIRFYSNETTTNNKIKIYRNCENRFLSECSKWKIELENSE